MSSNPDTLFPGLAVAQSPEEAEAEILRLVKAHYFRFTPQGCLLECLRVGFAHQNRAVLAATWSVGQRASAIEGMETLPRALAEKWCELLLDRPTPEAVAEYVDIALNGNLAALWEKGQGAYPSHLDMWMHVSGDGVFPASLHLVAHHAEICPMPEEALSGLLARIANGHDARACAALTALPLLLQGREAFLDAWLSHSLNQTSMLGLVLAVQRPQHDIWLDPDFRLRCLNDYHPPAMQCVVDRMNERELASFDSMMHLSSSAGAWNAAVGRRQAREQAAQLEEDVAQPGLRDRAAPRL